MEESLAQKIAKMHDEIAHHRGHREAQRNLNDKQLETTKDTKAFVAALLSRIPLLTARPHPDKVLSQVAPLEPCAEICAGSPLVVPKTNLPWRPQMLQRLLCTAILIVMACLVLTSRSAFSTANEKISARVLTETANGSS